MRLESLDHFNVLIYIYIYIYHSDLKDAILFFTMSLFLCTLPFFCMCVMYSMSFDGFF